MDIDWIRDLCLSFPQTTEHIQWGDDPRFQGGRENSRSNGSPARQNLALLSKFPRKTSLN